MTGDRPRDYDKKFTTPVDTRVRRRLGLDVDREEVTRFVVQLEYCLDAEQDTWVTVVRYDHNSEGSAEATHDVTEDGLHIDIYRDSKKVDSHELTPPLSANDAVERADHETIWPSISKGTYGDSNNGMGSIPGTDDRRRAR